MSSLPLICDSHAHLTSDALFEDVHDILARAREAGIGQVVNICTDRPTLERGLELAEQYDWVYNTGATTPHDVEKIGESDWEAFATAARSGRLVAVGETGLDYFYTHSAPEVQKSFFRRYLQLALECSLPIVIHCRDAFADFFEILDQDYVVDGRHAPGVLHCFTGTVAEAEAVLQRGWQLSLSGIVTFKRSEELREVAKLVPLEQLFIETDSPYLAPQKYRGKRNEPAYVRATAELIAEVKGVSVEELCDATRHNAEQFFGLTK